MARYYKMSINNITKGIVNGSELILYELEEELIRLDKLIFSYMIMQYETILRDLEDESKPVKKYYSYGDTVIYTKKVMELVGTEFVERKVLCIMKLLKVPVDVVIDANMFQEMILKTTILFRIQAKDWIETPDGPEYKLNSTQSFFACGAIFPIVSEDPPSKLLLPMVVLVDLIRRRKEILDDLDSQDSSDENIYWDDNGLTLKTIPSGKSREFCFYYEGLCECEPDGRIKDKIKLKKNTFDLMLCIALGARMWKRGMKEDGKIKESRMLFWDVTPFNIIHKIEFSDDLKRFVVTNDWYKIQLTLPIDALKAALNRKTQILSDLDSEANIPSREKDYINEYWTDETYAIRSGVMYNLYREVDCKVVRFEKIKDDNCALVAHKELFLKLLESYRRRKNYKNQKNNKKG